MKRRVSVLWGVVGLMSTAPAFAAGTATKNSPMLQKHLRGELGDQWKVAKEGGSIVATRTRQQTSGADMNEKVQQEIAKLHENQPSMTVNVQGGETHFAGYVHDCDEIVSQAGDFSRIQGVNRIVIDTRCGGK